MTRPMDPLFDERVADWLEDDPDRAPGLVLETVLAALPSIPQRRASLVGVRWHTPVGRLIAAAAVVLALTILGLALVASGALNPAPTHLSLDTRNWQGFEAPDLLYTIRLPPTWSMTQGVAGQADSFGGAEGTIGIAHEQIPSGVGQDDWRDARHALIASQQACVPKSAAAFEPVRVGSDNDRLYELTCAPGWLVIAAVGERGVDLRYTPSTAVVVSKEGKAFLLAVLRTFALWEGALPSPMPVDLLPFASTFYGYSIGYPTGWTNRPATRSLVGFEPPWTDGPAVDEFAGGENRAIAPNGQLVVANAELLAGTTLAAFTAQSAVTTCGETFNQETIELAGESATLTTFPSCYGFFHQWVTVVRGTTGWHIVWLNSPGSEGADRVILDRILASFEFPPG
jgi:hypothetical protein